MVSQDEGAGKPQEWGERASQRLQTVGEGQVVAGVDDDIGPQAGEAPHPGHPSLGPVCQVQIAQVQEGHRRLAGRQDGDVHAPQYGEARLEERVTKQAEPREGRADSGAGA